jgi:hypothetical protein
MAQDTTPAPSAPPARPSTAEPSDADLKSLIFGGAKPTAKPAAAAPVADPDEDDATPLDQAEPAAARDDEFADDDEPAPAPRAAAPAPAGEVPAEAPPEPAAPSADALPDPVADPETPALDEETSALRGQLPPEAQTVFDQAIRKQAESVVKLRTEVETLSQRAASAEAALQEARSAPAPAAVPTAADPLADVDDEAGLDQRLQQARALRRWALQHRDGGIVKDGEKEIEITPEKAGEILADADELLTEHGPRRRQFLQARAQYDAHAVSAYPWLKHAAGPGARAVEQTLKQYPALRSIFPGAKLAVADMLMGAHLRQQQQAKGAKPAAATPPPKAPASPSAGGARPPWVAGAVKASGDAQRKLEQTGDDPSNAALRGLLVPRG